MADLNQRMEDVFEPPVHLQNESHVPNLRTYQKMYKESVENPELFWGRIAEQFYWKSQPTGPFFDYNFDCRKGPIYIKWMEGAKTNICYNTLDRHVENGAGSKVAFYWEGNDPDDSSQITYEQLLKEVCKFSNVLKSQGIKRGDNVAIYMPMILELLVAMLACARIGAVHSIVFAGFSSESLSERIIDGRCCALLTADGVWRGTKLLKLKEIADGALDLCAERGHNVSLCVVVRHLTSDNNINGEGDVEQLGKRPCKKLMVSITEGRDLWWHSLMSDVSSVCEPEWMDAEDPLFMLYTSGSTGKPKGVLHTTAGYMLYAATTFKYVFDYQTEDTYWCTADLGWITGHTYICYGPMCNGATGVLFEGTPFHPDPGRLWAVVDKYKVTKFYTAPTVIRALMQHGEDCVYKHSRESLKVLGTVGEPINPEAWLWYYNVIGRGKCSIADTYWQTETGGHALTPLPGATPMKAGSATFPFFGIVPAIVTEEGVEIEGTDEGYLVFKQAWPGIMRTVFGDHERFETTYFKKFPGYYCTGDGAKRDKDGYIWITGRIDDMLNVSGHLLSTAEIESALIEHKAVTEAAVVAHPHPVKGECTYCFVTMKQGYEYNEKLEIELKEKVRTKIGPFAQPDYIQNAPGLPKTRSGKIMRRVLRNIAIGNRKLGDVSTLADESVIDILFKLRPNNS